MSILQKSKRFDLKDTFIDTSPDLVDIFTNDKLDLEKHIPDTVNIVYNFSFIEQILHRWKHPSWIII